MGERVWQKTVDLSVHVSAPSVQLKYMYMQGLNINSQRHTLFIPNIFECF